MDGLTRSAKIRPASIRLRNSGSTNIRLPQVRLTRYPFIRPAFSSPDFVQPEAGTVPANDGLGLHDHEELQNEVAAGVVKIEVRVWLDLQHGQKKITRNIVEGISI